MMILMIILDFNDLYSCKMRTLIIACLLVLIKIGDSERLNKLLNSQFQQFIVIYHKFLE